MFLHQNIRSFSKNSDEFILYFSQLQLPIDIMILTETWFTGEYTDDIEGYRGVSLL
jgi:hypothetical protein